MLRNNLITILLLLSTTLLRGQLMIATDYNSCLHGIQDKSGKWIVEPKYEQLERTRHGFIVSLSGKYGLIDTTGRTMIAPQYDHLESAFDSYSARYIEAPYYKVLLNQKYGIVDSAGRIVVPCKYIHTEGTADTTFIVEEGEDTWSFYDQNGSRFVCPWKSRSGPYRIMPHCYEVTKYRVFRSSLDGVVNDSGRIVVPQIYRAVYGFPTTNTISLRVKDRYGYCDGAGRMIWPLTFYFPKGSHYYYYDAQLLGRLGRGPAWIGDKCGMVSLKGDTLLPFVYDEIRPFSTYPEKRDRGNLWIVKQNGLEGIYDDVNGWRIPVSCSSIKTFETFYADGDSSQIGLLLYERNHLWGVITTQGQEVLPCEYDELTEDRYGSCILRKGMQIIEIGIVTNSHIESLISQSKGYPAYPINYPSRTSPNRVAPASGIFSVFEGRENCTVYFHPRLTHDSILRYKEKVLIDDGKYYQFVAPDTIIRSGCFYVQKIDDPDLQNGAVTGFRLNSLLLHSEGNSFPHVLHIASNNKHKLTFSDRYRSSSVSAFHITANNDIVSSDGRVLASGDSVTYVMTETHGHNNELFFVLTNDKDEHIAIDTNGHAAAPWREGRIGDYNETYLWRATDHWYLTDARTGKSLLPKKHYSSHDAPIWDSITLVENEEHGIRAYNIRRQQYLTTTGFSYLRALSPNGNLFAAKTCSGNIGIFRADGTWLTDTIWTAFTPLGRYTEYYDSWNEDVETSTLYFANYVFSNATGSYLLDIKTGSFVSTDQSWKFLWHNCIRSTEETYIPLRSIFWEVQRDDISYYEPYYLIPFTDTSRYSDWHKQIIVDTLFGSLRYDPPTYEDSIYMEEEFWDVDEMRRTSKHCWKCGWRYQNFLWTRQSCTGKSAAFFINDSVISFSHVYVSYYSDYMSKSDFSNVMLFPDGPRNMTLDSIFDPKSEWRTLIINTVLNYVNSHSHIEGDCHNPVALPLLLSDEWEFTPKGITLYPPGFYENSRELKITLDWKDIDSYLRADVKLKVHAVR